MEAYLTSSGSIPDRLDDFDYQLPSECIAQEPAAQRDASRLMLLRDQSNEHRSFGDLPHLLEPGDLLILNDTRVLAARLFARRASGGRIEVLLLSPCLESQEPGDEPDFDSRRWVALVKPGKKVSSGTTLDFGPGRAIVEDVLDQGERVLSFDCSVKDLMETSGSLPLPPYITGGASFPARYQTVFSDRPGAVAAPTAGLHFTHAILDRLRRAGIEIASLTLHVGQGTFRPVKVQDLQRHQMMAEWYQIPQTTCVAYERARLTGGRIIAVGTTVTRALETTLARHGRIVAGPGSSDLFIRPGFEFRAIDALLTNFHLPKSTLLMLVAAFAQHKGLGGLERIRNTYAEAISSGYRFFSFGDAMLLG